MKPLAFPQPNAVPDDPLRELQAETFDAEWECNAVGLTNHYIREFDVNTELLGV